jgi:UDP-N-acetylglucosamine 2-epimerase
MKKTLCFILGTRPEIIKLFPLIHVAQKRNLSFELIHTGQHYSTELHGDIWKDFNLPPVTKAIVLKHHEASLALGEMIQELSSYLTQAKKDRIIIVQGDTNSTLVGAIVANKLKIPLVHIEAGFRSGLKTQPEEINRILVDQLSDLNFAADTQCMKNLKKANLAITAVKSFNTAYAAAATIQKKLGSHEKQMQPFRLMTIHRAENSDNPQRLKKIWEVASALSKELPLVWFMHPRTMPQLEKLLMQKMNLKQQLTNDDLLKPSLIFMPPQNYQNFFYYLSQCKSVYSDSGGIVDESIFLAKHYICLRNETEQLEVLAKKRMCLLSPLAPLSAILKNAKKFEEKKFPKLTNSEKNKLLNAPEKMIEKIEKYF